MSKQLRKLTLNRETLAPLQSAELGGVHGGTAPILATVLGEEASVALVGASIRACIAVSGAVAGTAKGSYGGVKKAIDTAKKVGGWLKKHL